MLVTLTMLMVEVSISPPVASRSRVQWAQHFQSVRPFPIISYRCLQLIKVAFY